MPFTFYLGTHVLSFLTATRVPLFISRRTLASRRRLRSCTTYAVDSNGFTELSMYGCWTVKPGVYAAECRWWYDTLPGFQWAAIQDWMCEPEILQQTGLTVEEHQRRTITSYLRLHELQPTLPWVPVLQGYRPAEYMNHLRMYEDAGVDLRGLERVGVGSICRRQSADVEEAAAIIRELKGEGLRLHLFGFKSTGLERCAVYLGDGDSADSLAWSKVARQKKLKLAGCTHSGNCANCLTWALQWREKLLAGMEAA
jgi:hypothetical protein